MRLAAIILMRKLLVYSSIITKSFSLGLIVSLSVYLYNRILQYKLTHFPLPELVDTLKTHVGILGVNMDLELI